MIARFFRKRSHEAVSDHSGTTLALDISTTAPRDRLCERARLLEPHARVLEVGTRQVIEGIPTHSQNSFPTVARANYVMADVKPGTDVDVVADLHHLPDDWTDHFDVFVANAVFEHLERPWIAAMEVHRVLKAGGLCYVNTHQTYPLHGHPSDFFRFSREALTLIFTDAGFRVVEAGYEHRAEIIPPISIVPQRDHKFWNQLWPSYISVHVFAEKP